MVSEMTPTRRALAAVLGGRVDYVPPANPLAQTTTELMQVCNASWPKAHFDSKMMADIAAAPYEICGIEAARPQFDISLEAEVLGCKLDWNKPDRPPVTGLAYYPTLKRIPAIQSIKQYKFKIVLQNTSS